jgi:hypothetical protein
VPLRPVDPTPDDVERDAVDETEGNRPFLRKHDAP